MRVAPILAALGLVALVARLASASSSAVTYSPGFTPLDNDWSPDPYKPPLTADPPDEIARLDAESDRLEARHAEAVEDGKAAIRRGDRVGETEAQVRAAALRDARMAVERQRTALRLAN